MPSYFSSSVRHASPIFKFNKCFYINFKLFPFLNINYKVINLPGQSLLATDKLIESILELLEINSSTTV